MSEEFEYNIHEYTYVSHSEKLVHTSHKTNNAKNKIRELAKNNPFDTKVLFVLNGIENEEEAYIFEGKAMMRAYSYHATKAVEIIACLPFFQYTGRSIIKQLTESMHRDFINRPDENQYLF